ncbi:oxidoreductase [Cellulomonas aerilata]|uniref:Putative short-chain dehydrogenase/reductase n=1 Tax=Cellulomonas aerilata TaxID=515326 RepID=A0A512DG95_9CELL|nr:oxidoreductase [Cellulomonas aerilata]GEO35513.1 putative short-chain dehydrogenase/reductase [Cellulomonas aerilata]
MPTRAPTTAAARWSADDIPDLDGRRAVVTGANSGLGLQTAIGLAAHGASVVLACRDAGRGEAARATLRAETGKDAELQLLDLADLASVARFADDWGEAPLDVLVCNAGVMAVPRGTTRDGFETQIGTNHLGHFALVGRLLPALRRSPDARVVVVSSAGHRMGRIDLEDLGWERRPYRPWRAYGQSKLANLLFARELDRRLRAHGDPVVAVAAHPGLASSNLSAPFVAGLPKPLAALYTSLGHAVEQSDADGALPSLYAATMPDVRGGEYFGPDGRFEQRGAPTRVGRSDRATDDVTARGLWSLSERLTGVTYPDLPPVGPTAGG